MATADVVATDQQLLMLQEATIRWANEAQEEGRHCAGLIFSLKASEIGCILLERRGQFEVAEAARRQIAEGQERLAFYLGMNG